MSEKADCSSICRWHATCIYRWRQAQTSCTSDEVGASCAQMKHSSHEPTAAASGMAVGVRAARQASAALAFRASLLFPAHETMSLLAGLRHLGATIRCAGGPLGLRAGMGPAGAPPPTSTFVRFMKVRSAIKKRCQDMLKTG